jgi:hypothetical protein
MSDSETTATSSSTSSSTDEEADWAPPRGSKYVELTRRVHGGGAVPWASGLEGRASAAHGSAVATRELNAAKIAMAQAYDAFSDAVDAHMDAVSFNRPLGSWDVRKVRVNTESRANHLRPSRRDAMRIGSDADQAKLRGMIDRLFGRLQADVRAPRRAGRPRRVRPVPRPAELVARREQAVGKRQPPRVTRRPLL